MAQTEGKSKTPGKEGSVRVLERPKYKSLRLQKRIKHPAAPIVSSWKLMKQNIKHLLKYKRLFLGISTVYFVSSIILVNGLIGSSDFEVLKDSLREVVTGSGGELTTGFALFGALLVGGTNSSVSESGSVYQTILIVLVSLAVIWALRQTYAKVKTTTKQAFYVAMTPIVPFCLVLGVIGLQLIPLLAGSTIYSIVVSQGIAATTIEQALWALLMMCLVVLTLYMITSSIFALYIVTLPDVQPMQALRSARELVRYRRWSIMRKVVFLPFSLLIMAAIIMVPVLLYATVIAQWVFLFLSMVALVVVHGYMYRLYRELL